MKEDKVSLTKMVWPEMTVYTGYIEAANGERLHVTLVSSISGRLAGSIYGPKSCIVDIEGSQSTPVLWWKKDG